MGSCRRNEAVLKAADDWLTAQETLMEMRNGSHEAEAEEELVAVAEVRLVLAIKAWRLDRKVQNTVADKFNTT